MAAQLDTLEPIPVRCTSCHGTGYACVAYRASCQRCHASWTPERIAAHLDAAWGGWWGYRLLFIGDLPWLFFARLPCGCLKRHLHWQPVACRACAGAGVVTDWQPRRQRPQCQHRPPSFQRPQVRQAWRNPPVPPMQTLTPRLDSRLDSRLATAPISAYTLRAIRADDDVLRSS